MSCSSCPKRTNPDMLIQLVPGEPKKPDFLKLRASIPNERYKKIRALAKDLNLATVCQEALCPNINECWGGGTATFMIMGDTCTRACRFCNVNHGKPGALDPDEPKNLAHAISQLDLDYIVITSVDRDDMPDGGSAHFAACIRELREKNPKLLLEVLTPDFQGKEVDIQRVVDAGPHVYAHNIETVERLQKGVRDHRANYRQSLGVLKYVKKYLAETEVILPEGTFAGRGADDHASAAPTPSDRRQNNLSRSMFTKSSIMVGLGETKEEVLQAMHDLRKIDVDFLTIGQYLRPTAWNLKVVEYIPPEIFEQYRVEGEKMGFKYVASGPFVRSSYKAGEYYIKNYC